MRSVRAKSPRRDWRDVEREFKAKRDPKMKITLPKLAFMGERERARDDTQRRVA